MAQPTAYTKATNFAQDEANNVGGRSSVRTSRVDGELAAIATTLSETLRNLALIQRDDGKLRDGLVEIYNLSATALAALQSSITARGLWATSVSYAAYDLVDVNNQAYLCVTAHTSGVFATDYLAGKWQIWNFDDLEALSFTQSGSGAVNRSAQNKMREFASVKDFGAMGDGVTDDTSAFLAAVATGKNVFVPYGTYVVSSTIAVNYVTLYGEGATASKILYSGSGFCITVTAGEKGAGVRDLGLEATATGKSGINLLGAVGCVLRSLYINKFDQYGIRIGNIDSAIGCYWSVVEEVRLRLDSATNGACGVLVDGGSIPSSNSNILRNVVIGGNYQKSLWIRGNGNTVNAGTIELSRATENAESLIYIEGNGNVVRDVYTEPLNGMPAKLVTFGANSSGNEVDLWCAWGPVDNTDARVDDLGRMNRLKVRSPSANYSVGLPSDGAVNLLPNAALSIWRDANHPAGWAFGTARITKDAAGARAGSSAILMTEAASASTIQAYLNDYFTSTYGGPAYPLAMFAGQNVVVGAFCKTTLAGAGCVKLAWQYSGGASGNSAGNELHTGGGDWELLTAHARLPDDLSRIWLELRSHVTNANQTGQILFSDPFVIIGTQPAVFLPRAVPDNGGKVYGDLELYSVGTTATDSAMLKLGNYWLWVDPASGKLRVKSGTRPTNLASDGTVVGTQT